MDDYIRKDEAINLLEHNDKVFHYADRDKENIVNDTINTLCRVLIEMKSEDVQPVKRGRWIKQESFWNKNTVKCSLCGNYLDMNGVNGGRSDANYCPNCGARMDGNKEKDNNVGHLTDEETAIYESWIESEAEDTGENIMDGDAE